MCGIIGIFRQHAVSADLCDGLIHLQHRGQDAAGIITCDERFHIHKGEGLVREIFNQQNLEKLSGNMGIAHVRYPTSGGYSEQEIQPFWTNSPYGIALAHNGNLVNDEVLSKQLCQKQMRHLNTSNDSEVLLQLFADGLISDKPIDDPKRFFKQICQSVSSIQQQVTGSYSIVASIIGKGLLAFRDPHGIRPLILGRQENEKGTYDYILSSETTVLYPLGFERVDDIQPGEVIFIDINGNLHRKTLETKTFSPCIFEYVYFARPDSILDEVSVYRSRLRMGQNLAEQWKKQFPDILPDVVIPVPFTSNTAALAFAGELNVRYTEGLYKNPFIGRTFIMPNKAQRKRSVRYKLIPQETEIRDKNVLLLDDSIVRGTTSKEIVKMVREHGAKKVYFVTTCPPIKFPCFYGIDIPSPSELIANNKSLKEIQDYLGVDQLLYQTLDDLEEAVTRKGEHHIDKPCMACLNGQYISGNIDKHAMQHLEQKRQGNKS